MKILNLLLIILFGSYSPLSLTLRQQKYFPAYAQSGQITASDISYLGCVGIPRTDRGGLGDEPQAYITGRIVGGNANLLLSQNRSGSSFGPWSLWEGQDPLTYSSDCDSGSSAKLTFVKNWGISSGASYDMWGGLFGKTYDASGTLVYDGGSLQDAATGIHWTAESATCCALITYALPYGQYSYSWNTVVADLTNGGTGSTNVGLNTTTVGPLRWQSGTYPFGSGFNSLGPKRAMYFVNLPDGSCGHGSSNGFTQQEDSNRGVALFGGAPCPNLSTPVGFGSARGSQTTNSGTCGGSLGPCGRSTDILSTDDYIAAYSLDNFIDGTGAITGGRPNWSTRRPAVLTKNYIPEAFTCTASGQINAEEIDWALPQYSNVGSWTAEDNSSGVAQITTADGKTGTIFLVYVSTGHGWYKTPSCTSFLRNADEIAAGGGPLWCPRHNVDSGVSVTGPNTTEFTPYLLIYSNACLNLNKLGSQPDYSCEPEWVDLQALFPTMQFAPKLNPNNGLHNSFYGRVGGMWYDVVHHNLYIEALGADHLTDFGGFLPIIQKLHIGS